MKDEKLRDERCSTDKECEQRNTAVDKYYTVIGLSSMQIAMSGTIGISRGCLFFFYPFPLRLRAKAARRTSKRR